MTFHVMPVLQPRVFQFEVGMLMPSALVQRVSKIVEGMFNAVYESLM